MYKTDRMLERRWGVFNHFLYRFSDTDRIFPRLDWDEQVARFDVERVARDLHKMGAGWYFITLMQGDEHMLAPNRTFDAIAGTRPGEACAGRDLVLDLYEALRPYDIDLYLYYTGDGPYLHPEIGARFGYTEPRGQVQDAFVQKWSAVLEEYALRYGDKVKGWWFDGMYGDYFGYDNRTMEPYYRAVKKGNPDCLTAFNNGVKPECCRWYAHEEMTCGEFNDFSYIPPARYIDGAQAHILAPLGLSPDGNPYGGWRRPGAKLDHASMKEYLRRVNAAGGVLTTDIVIWPDSSWDELQISVLSGI